MKTTKQWLQTLPKGLRESAVKNIFEGLENVKLKKLSHAVYCLHRYNTEEGLAFWASFYECLKWAEGE